MTIDLTNIKNIIFDLGRVILDLDPDGTVEAFRKLGLNDDIVDVKLAYSDEVFNKLQKGTATPAEFRARVRELLKNESATDQQIDDAWNAILLDIPLSRIKTIKKLGERYNIYMFSNTNSIHIDKLSPEFKEQHGFAYEDLFTAVYYSHEITDAKPAVCSFEKVIKLSGVKPEETLFVDDLEKNIEGAQQAGLKTLWFEPHMDFDMVFAIQES